MIVPLETISLRKGSEREKGDALLLRNNSPEIDDEEVTCRKCHWPCALPSRRRNVIDLLVLLCLLRPYRCRSCHRRHYRFLVSQKLLIYYVRVLWVWVHSIPTLMKFLKYAR